MHIEQPLPFAQGFGIAARFLLALAAISLLSRPNPAGPGEAAAQPPKPATKAGEVREKAASLPPDYLDICRAAGI